jgi:adenine-specific DNA-methyltransferase
VAGRQHYEGKLELTWTNKDLSLLAHEDSSYEWVPQTDYRVAEVRLLREAETVGEVRADTSRAKDNLLIRGDALHALTSLLGVSEYAREYAAKVKLVYIDPPFNTQQAFEHYDDALEHSVWLTMIRDRLEQVKELLADDGSVWVHCDDSEQHRLRCVMDEVFGRDKFVATVLWQKRYSRDNRPAIGAVHDFIHVYAPDPDRWKKVRNRLPRDAKTAKQYRNPNNDPRGPWRAIPIDAQGYRKNQMYDIVAPNGKVHRPSKGRCWGMLEGPFLELVKEGRIYWGKDGKGRPGVIRYLSETEGLVPWTWWPNEEVGHNDEAKKEILELFPDVEAFGTPKPERLMRRIIEVATNPNEIVLDCFVGSGTTAAVAQKTGRRWVGVEWSRETLDTFTSPRLTKVVEGKDPGGITEEAGWQGGGGFRILDVAPSMFGDDDGLVVLADWAVGGKLGEATAAQLGYDYEPVPPFVGRKGRTRLAVIDGLVNADVARLLLRSLGEKERLVLCGTAVDPETRDLLRELRPGSTVRKIPASILAEYQIGQRWVSRGSRKAESAPAEAMSADGEVKKQTKKAANPKSTQKKPEEELAKA